MPKTTPREALTVKLGGGTSNTLVRVGERACDAVRAEAAERGCSVADVVRDAVAPIAAAFGDDDLGTMTATRAALGVTYAEVLRLAVLARVEPRLGAALAGRVKPPAAPSGPGATAVLIARATW